MNLLFKTEIKKKLVIKIDTKLSFSNHISSLCKKTKKLHAVVRIVSYMDLILREKCPNTKFFWPVFSCIQTKYGDLLRKFPYSVFPYLEIFT